MDFPKHLPKSHHQPNWSGDLSQIKHSRVRFWPLDDSRDSTQRRRSLASRKPSAIQSWLSPVELEMRHLECGSHTFTKCGAIQFIRIGYFQNAMP